MSKRGPLVLFAVALFGSSILCFCSRNPFAPDSTGELAIEVRLSDHAPSRVRGDYQLAVITTVTVTVTAPDLDHPVTVDLSVSGGQASGSITVAAGRNRLITVEAKDTRGVVQYTGSQTVDVEGGKTTNVTIVLTGDPPDPVELGPPSEIGTCSMRLYWGMSGDEDSDFSSYKIHYSQASNVDTNDQLLYETPNISDTSHTVTGLEANTIYYFKVFVYDTEGLYSASAEVSGRTRALGTDSLTYSFNPNIFYWGSGYDTYYEATRFDVYCPLKVGDMYFLFFNYENSTMSKECTFYIWKDNAGKPGLVLYSGVDTVSVAGPDSFKWFKVPVSSENIELSEPFWIGHKENSAGAPTSTIDTVGTPDKNYYSADGHEWSEDDYDYLQYVVVDWTATGFYAFDPTSSLYGELYQSQGMSTTHPSLPKGRISSGALGKRGSIAK